MTVGIGVIGTGFARRIQIPSFLGCEDTRIVSVASGSLANAKAAAGEFGIEHFTDDWRETVSRGDVDLVCITTPPKLHREMTLAALENGKHVLCEKPMAMSAGEAREMLDAAQTAGVLALIDHELRFQAGRQKAHAMLRQGDIGKVRHVKYHFQAPHRGDPDAEWNWWSDETQGGGALGAIVSHVIDSFHWFLGTSVSTVFCQLQTHIKQRRDADGIRHDVTTDDESLLVLRFAQNHLTVDATGLVSVSMTEYPDYKNRIEFYGTEGSLAVEHRGEIFIASAEETDWRAIDVPMGPPVKGIPDTGFARGFMEFAPKIVAAIRDGKGSIEHAATFEDGLAIQHVLDAARESDRTGQVMAVREETAAA
ncbi:MAG TPA: Gfo/Idh/MocA family oxidoreductase [Pyrinomonadaceae bacterium]